MWPSWPEALNQVLLGQGWVARLRRGQRLQTSLYKPEAPPSLVSSPGGWSYKIQVAKLRQLINTRFRMPVICNDRLPGGHGIRNVSSHLGYRLGGPEDGLFWGWDCGTRSGLFVWILLLERNETTSYEQNKNNQTRVKTYRIFTYLFPIQSPYNIREAVLQHRLPLWTGRAARQRREVGGSQVELGGRYLHLRQRNWSLWKQTRKKKTIEKA